MSCKPNSPMKTPVALLSFALVFGSGLMAADQAAPAPDQPFKIVAGPSAQYPARMLNEGVSHGTVRAVLHVDSTGKLVDYIMVAYTHVPFADEAERVIRRWKFVPPVVRGEPLDTIVEVGFNFEVNGVMLVQKFGLERTEVENLWGYEYQACSLKNLDRIPTPVNIVSPTYPKEWAEKGLVGSVVVDFYIDEQGKVRMAAAPSSADPMLAGIAVAAVNKWTFAPPTRKGRPVLVHARQVFDFQRETASVAPTAAASR